MDRSVVLKGQYIAAMDALMAGESCKWIRLNLKRIFLLVMKISWLCILSNVHAALIGKR